MAEPYLDRITARCQVRLRYCSPIIGRDNIALFMQGLRVKPVSKETFGVLKFAIGSNVAAHSMPVVQPIIIPAKVVAAEPVVAAKPAPIMEAEELAVNAPKIKNAAFIPLPDGHSPAEQQVETTIIKRKAAAIPLPVGEGSDTTASTEENPPTSKVPHGPGVLLNTMVFVTSDNIKAGEQTSKLVQHPYTLTTPQGCHIELDPSPACHMFTVSYWFMLSLSNVLVTQLMRMYSTSYRVSLIVKSISGTHSIDGVVDPILPSSAFSRFAGMYGLKPNPYRNLKDCDNVVSTMRAGYLSS
eukprot:gene2705-3690_t